MTKVLERHNVEKIIYDYMIANNVGQQGVTGPIGATGISGMQGHTGPRGFRGQQGVTGPLGGIGSTGYGSTGLRGVTGPAGGSKGATGIQGVTGISGGGSSVILSDIPPENPSDGDTWFSPLNEIFSVRANNDWYGNIFYPTIQFNANGGSGYMLANSWGAFIYAPYCEFTREGYTFSHWNTKADDSGTSYTVGDSLTPRGSYYLYAQWNLIVTDTVGSDQELLVGRDSEIYNRAT